MRNLSAEYIVDKLGIYAAVELANEILALVERIEQWSRTPTTEYDLVAWGVVK